MTTTCPACRATVTVPARTRDGMVQCGGCGREFAPPDAPADGEAPPAPAPQKQYPVLPFKPPRGGSAVRLVVPAVVGLVVAPLFALGAAILKGFLWIVLVFPFLHGMLVGLFPGVAARLAKARRPGLLATVGALTGLLSYVGVHFLFYVAFLADPKAPNVGFLEYLDIRATEGVRFGKPGANNAGGGIGYTGTVIYWIVEALATAAGAAITTVLMIESPFCVGCNRWKAKRLVGPFAVEPQYAVAAVGVGVPAGLLVPADAGKKVALTVYHCPSCAEDGTIDVKAHGTSQEGKNMLNWNAFVTYPGEALPEFDRLERTLVELGLGGKRK